MPAYSFMERFVPMVLDGSKQQTVRARRKHPPRVGQVAYNYFGMRTRSCRKLNQAPITDVLGIVINQEHGIVLYNGPLDSLGIEVAKSQPFHKSLPFRIILTLEDCNRFAWQDGFRPEGTTMNNNDGCYMLMKRFWAQTHVMPFSGDVIYWNPTSPFTFFDF